MKLEFASRAGGGWTQRCERREGRGADCTCSRLRTSRHRFNQTPRRTTSKGILAIVGEVCLKSRWLEEKERRRRVFDWSDTDRSSVIDLPCGTRSCKTKFGCSRPIESFSSGGRHTRFSRPPSTSNKNPFNVLSYSFLTFPTVLHIGGSLPPVVVNTSTYGPP